MSSAGTNQFVLGESPWLPIALLLASAVIAWSRRSRAKALVGRLRR
jgi:hypothetical protein